MYQLIACRLAKHIILQGFIIQGCRGAPAVCVNGGKQPPQHRPVQSMELAADAQVIFMDMALLQNAAPTGPALHAVNSTVVMLDCSIEANEADDCGAVYLTGSSWMAINSSFVNNNAQG